MISLCLITSQMYIGHHSFRKDVSRLIDVVEKAMDRTLHQDIWFAGEDAAAEEEEEEEREHSALLGWCRLASKARMRLASERRTQQVGHLSRQVAILEAELEAVREQLLSAQQMARDGALDGDARPEPAEVFEHASDREIALLVRDMQRMRGALAAAPVGAASAAALADAGYRPPAVERRRRKGKGRGRRRAGRGDGDAGPDGEEDPAYDSDGNELDEDGDEPAPDSPRMEEASTATFGTWDDGATARNGGGSVRSRAALPGGGQRAAGKGQAPQGAPQPSPPRAARGPPGPAPRQGSGPPGAAPGGPGPLSPAGAGRSASRGKGSGTDGSTKARRGDEGGRTPGGARSAKGKGRRRGGPADEPDEAALASKPTRDIASVDAYLQDLQTQLRGGEYGAEKNAVVRSLRRGSTARSERASLLGLGFGEALSDAASDAAFRDARALEQEYAERQRRFEAEDLSAPQFTTVRIAHVDPALMAHNERRLHEQAQKARMESHTAAALENLFVRDGAAVMARRNRNREREREREREGEGAGGAGGGGGAGVRSLEGLDKAAPYDPLEAAASEANMIGLGGGAGEESAEWSSRGDASGA